MHEEGSFDAGERHLVMMKPCTEAPCSNWAQWRITTPATDEKGKVLVDKNGKILRLVTIGLVCGQCKNRIEKTPREQELRFNFIGAVPLGAKSSQP
jgi:hypothetical protein